MLLTGETEVLCPGGVSIVPRAGVLAAESSKIRNKIAIKEREIGLK